MITQWTTLAFYSVFALASLMSTAYYTSANDYRDRRISSIKTEGNVSNSRYDFDADAGEVRYVARLQPPGVPFAFLTLLIDLAYLYIKMLRLRWSIIMGGARVGSPSE